MSMLGRYREFVPEYAQLAAPVVIRAVEVSKVKGFYLQSVHMLAQFVSSC